MNRLRKNSGFKRVYAKGRSCPDRLAVLCYLPTGEDDTKVGFSVSKKIGCAVVRNKTKRRMREIVRAISGDIKPGYDIVIIARKRTAEAEFSDMSRGIRNLFRRADLLCSRK
ncbi:MAG: ribonuclease P protein component [Abditibacteriota bacterium]|nr:ribonuclease P protein component [Abditibacteriota bacterium]MBP5093439.1 ribonuclease P protein component [Abditibacteriota bacterium]MBP5717710.1 ribonuclease P protein component [Abditibacteriota bacterium]MBP5737473.1 ribonuclease P protein component [Abditibacteriota bacterium]